MNTELGYDLLGICGVAQSGKDTLCEYLIQEYKERGIIAKRFSIADIIRDDLNHLFQDRFGIDIYTCTLKEKELLRPIIIEHGIAFRKLTEGTGFTNILNDRIDMWKSFYTGTTEETSTFLPIITDIRYHEYPKDEYFWIRENKGKLIHVERVDTNGVPVPPNNEHEKRNDPILKLYADISLSWEDMETNTNSSDWLSKSEYFSFSATRVISELDRKFGYKSIIVS